MSHVSCNCLEMFSVAGVLRVILQLRLLLSGDVEQNPGPDTARLGE